MKKLFNFFTVIVAVLTLFACNKESNVSELPEGSKEVLLTFNSKKPGLINPETKTAWDGSTIKWTKGDAIRIAYTVNGNWQTATGNGTPAKMYASDQLKEEEAGEVANFKVSTYFTDEDNEDLTNPIYKFYGIYPSSVGSTNFNNPPTLSVTIPLEQTPSASTFDPNADIMWAETKQNYAGIPDDRVVELYWHRIVSHADISMRNLQIGADETLEEISIEAQSGADLVGTHNFNITNGEITLPSTATANNKVVIKPDNLTLSGGAVEFWFTTLPFTASELKFTVKTNKYSYVRKFSGLELMFKGNARNVLSVNMKNAQKLQDYSESFSNNQGDFTTEGVGEVWTHGSSGDISFMKGSSYQFANPAVTGWLVSPYLRILNVDSELSFMHSINKYFGTLTDEATVWVRVKGEDWQQLTDITYPENPSSGFSTYTESISSLSTYVNQEVQIGFKYVGTASNQGTWDVKDFIVTNAEVKFYPTLTFTSETTKDVPFTASTVEFIYNAAHLTSAPSVGIKEGSDNIIDGTPTISEGKVTVNIKANNETVAKTATLVVSCDGVTGIPELVIKQAAKENLVETTATIDFTTKGYTNAQVVNSVTQDPFIVDFTKGGNNDPKYYTSGGGSMRFYSGGTMTVSSEYTITKIVMTGTIAATVNGVAISNKTWSGSSKSVVFTATGTNQIQKMTITYLAPATTNTNGYYELVTTVADITAGTYVVGALRSSEATNNFYFGKAEISSGDWLVSESYVTVAEDNGVRRFEVANLPSGAVEFTLTGNNTNGFTISNGSNYLYFTANSNRKLAFAADGSSQKWKVAAKNEPLINGGVYLSAVGDQNYTISENSTATGAIRGYANTNCYRAIYLFKRVSE